MDEDLKACADNITSEFAEPDYQKGAEVVDSAVHVLALPDESDDKKAYDVLLKYGLITTDEHAIAVQTKSPYGFPDLACALMWMLHHGVIPEERWNALRARLQNERVGGAAGECESIVEQAHESWELFKAQRSTLGPESGRKVSSGRIFAVAACCALLAAGYFLYQLTVSVGMQ